MSAIVISSDSESDSDFERDLAEAKRRSILESRLNIGERNDAGKGAVGFVKKEETQESYCTAILDDENIRITSPSKNEHEVDDSSNIDSDDSLMNKDVRKYLHDDESLPIYDIRNSGCTYSEAVKILLDGDQSIACSKQPILVENNYMFLVNLTSLDDPDDIKSDDCGHWVRNGRKSTYIAVKSQNGKVSNVKSIVKPMPPDENSTVYCLVRTYYIHDPHGDFKRIFYHIFDAEKVRHPLCLVQYYFDGTPHELHARSHGNSKSDRPYARSMKSVHNQLRQTAGKVTPKQALKNSLQDCGGVSEARSLGSIPKSRSQVRYHQAKNKDKSSGSDSLFSVMIQCKSTDPNSDDAFVRSVVAAPEPMAVLATNRQLNDMVRFLTDPLQHTVMGIDPTFNFGDFKVTPIVFRYLLLEHRKEGHSPIILGPLLVHQQRKFTSYHFFASTLISLCPSLRDIKVFGSDGETQLYQAFQMQLPEATHLHCFCHFRANLVSKLTSLGLPSEVINQYMKDVFGRTTEGVHEVGLVDMMNEVEFEQRIEALHETWDQREMSVVPHRSPTFFNWFVKEKSIDIKSSMLLPLREAAGLGSPPSPFYTNASESLNNMLHAKVQYKKSQWHDFNESMKELIKETYNLVELAVIDIGDFKFKSQYHHLVVPQSRWFKMTSQQRQHHLSKVSSTPVSSTPVNDCGNSIDDSAVPLNDLQGNMSLSLSVEEAKIQSLPRAVLDGIWGKAKQLINTSGQIVEGPCSSSSSTKCYIVASKTSDRPHIVQHNNKSGQFCCDSSCPMWQSSKICAHCIAAAEFSQCLEEFVLWYNKSKSKPNLDKLSKVDMPKGSGRKGEKPPRKKKRGSTTCFTLVEQSTNSSVGHKRSKVPVSSVQSVDCTVSKLSDSDATPSCHAIPRPPFPPSSNPWMCMPSQTQYGYQSSYYASPPVSNNFCFSSVSPYSPLGCHMWNTPFSAPFMSQPHNAMQQQVHNTMQHQERNLHPFFVRFIVGNIRVCQGCRGNLRLSDGSVPSPPNNLVAARLEKRPYFDKVNGTWCYPQKETHSHYHLKLSCVVKAEPLFVPSTLQVPPEVFPDLLQVHFELLATEFALNLKM